MKPVIVIECGSTLRVGFSGELKPRYVTSSCFFSRWSQEKLFIRYLRARLDLLFMEILQVEPKDQKILVVENALTPRAFREALFYSLTIDFNVQSVSFQTDLLMPLIATGGQSGLIVDIGHYESRSMAMIDGRPSYGTLRSVPLGLAHAYKRFQREFKSMNDKVPHTTEKKIFEKLTLGTSINTIKTERRKEVSATNDTMTLDFVARIPGILRSSCLDELIRGPQRDGKDESNDEIGGIIGLINSTLDTCSPDMLKTILEHVVICGGAAAIPGVIDKLRSEFGAVLEVNESEILLNLNGAETSKSLSRGYPESKITNLMLNCKYTPFNPSQLIWLGSSIFACLTSNEVKYVFFHRNQSTDGNDDNLLHDDKTMPDWMSLNSLSWYFLKSRYNH